jgi:hypothetical protein
VRYEFLEFILRCSLIKYCENGNLDEATAIQTLANDFLYPYMRETSLEDPFFYNQQEWRVNRYWNEPCDNLFKAYQPLFQQVYNTYGGKNKKPGQKHFMNLEEFISVVD